MFWRFSAVMKGSRLFRLLLLVSAIAVVFVMLSPPVTVSNASATNAGFLAAIDPIPSDANVLHISTAAELAAIGGPDSEGKYYVLDNDINLTEEWIPIDDFGGTLDGRGYCINNLYTLKSSQHKLISGFYV